LEPAFTVSVTFGPAPVAAFARLESALSATSVHVPENVDSLHKIFVSDAKPRRRKKERMVALRPHTSKHIRGGWSHYTDTSEPVEVMGLKI
jgi:hypothetical protein